MGRARQPPPPVHDYDIRWPEGAKYPIFFTWYKGHKFEGWIGREAFERAESDGVLSWDENGNPVIRGEENHG